MTKIKAAVDDKRMKNTFVWELSSSQDGLKNQSYPWPGVSDL
jgi:hypothetical protein